MTASVARRWEPASAWWTRTGSFYWETEGRLGIPTVLKCPHPTGEGYRYIFPDSVEDHRTCWAEYEAQQLAGDPPSDRLSMAFLVCKECKEGLPAALRKAAEMPSKQEEAAEAEEWAQRARDGETVYRCSGCDYFTDGSDALPMWECSYDGCGTEFVSDDRHCPDCNRPFSRKRGDMGCPECEEGELEPWTPQEEEEGVSDE